MIVLHQGLRFPIAALLFTLLCLAPVYDAQACRDCPFPMRVGDNRWLLPSGSLELEIEIYNLTPTHHEIQVTLFDAVTQESLAIGRTTQRKAKKTVHIVLFDRYGRLIQGVITFVDSSRERIRAKFTCQFCTISRELD